MTFLLTAVNAKYIHSNPAIYSLRSYAVSKAPELSGMIELAEYTINHELSAILADLYHRKPDIIGFSCYIWNWKLVQDIVREIHKLFPDMPIWLGGPEVSYEPQEALRQLPMVTGIMVGEGEETFLELMQYYALKAAHGMTLQQISGLYLPDGSTGERKLTELSEIPFLYQDLDAFQNRIIYYESGRGCPFRCSYCLSSIDKKVRLRDLQIVKKELQFFLDQKAAQVKFVDRTFNCSHEHATEIWRYIKEHDNGVTNFHFEIEADLLTEEELALLHSFRPGLAQMEIGVQSANPETLREIRRYAKLERIKEVVASIESGHNIHIHLDLIAGLPYEDYDSFHHSFNEVYSMKPQQLQLGFLKVLKGSHMYEMARQYGLQYLSGPPYEVLFTKWLSYGDVIRLKRVEEMVELYYNSNQFTHILPVIIREFEDAFSMYEALADYYEEHGYFVRTPSRAYRYEVLLQFAVLRRPEKETLYVELLTYDMYLRENLKARTGFMKDLKPWQLKIQAFYEKEEKQPELLKDYRGYHARQTMKMTHMEVFDYPVWRTQGQEEKLSTPAFLLFDYQSREPLTGNARTVVTDK